MSVLRKLHITAIQRPPASRHITKLPSSKLTSELYHSRTYSNLVHTIYMYNMRGSFYPDSKKKH